MFYIVFCDVVVLKVLRVIIGDFKESVKFDLRIKKAGVYQQSSKTLQNHQPQNLQPQNL